LQRLRGDDNDKSERRQYFRKTSSDYSNPCGALAIDQSEGPNRRGNDEKQQRYPSEEQAQRNLFLSAISVL
jgi:hypothetical protein